MKSFRDSRDLENGNTISSSKSKKPKQTVQLTSWFFTLNNYTAENIIEIQDKLKPICIWFCFQEEKGENGTEHLQGVFLLKKKMRWSEFNLPKTIHFEKTRNIEKAKEYCLKEESRNGKQWKFGFPIPIKIIQELRPWQLKIEELILTEPDDRTINWYWEEKGNIGKSAFVKYCVIKHQSLFCDGGKKADLINLVFNADMEKAKCIFWDLPRSTRGSISYSTLESVKNGLVCNTKYETGVKAFNPPHIIVFANFPPEKVEELSADRWKITCLD